MSVEPISSHGSEAPAVRSGEAVARAAAVREASSPPPAPRDEAVFTDVALKLAAALAADEAAHRLHLSPPELRQMITRPEPGPLQPVAAAKPRPTQMEAGTSSPESGRDRAPYASHTAQSEEQHGD